MSLITEDGTARPDSESFASVAESLTYHSDRGNSAWALLTTAVQEQSLRKATEYMAQTYRLRWAGNRINSTQALDWPRFFVPRVDALNQGLTLGSLAWYAYYDSASVPVEVKRACMELALKASTADLAPDLARATTSEKVGEIQVTYQPGNRQYVKYRAIDNLLAPVLKYSESMGKVIRV